MKKLDRKGILKIISATSMVIFSLIVSFSGAIAWYNAVRKVDNTGDNFVISGNATISRVLIAPFLGETVDTVNGEEKSLYYTFDQNNIEVAYNRENNENTQEPIVLNQYSLENPNHPILMLFEVEGDYSSIVFKTDYAFLGKDRNDFITAKAATKSALNSMSKTNGCYYEVLADESLGSPITGKTSLYYYSNDALINVTYADKGTLDEDMADFTADDNNRYYRVVADEVYGGDTPGKYVSTIYQYKRSSRSLDMVWIDLGDSAKSQRSNPLSSVVQFHSFTFADELEDIPTNHKVNVETYNPSNDVFSYEVTNNVSCIAIPKSGFTSDNKSSFTNFTYNQQTKTEIPDYSKEVVAFDDAVSGKRFVGIVVNYDSVALEYVFSNNLGHDALNSGLSFVCDWKAEF